MTLEFRTTGVEDELEDEVCEERKDTELSLA